MKKFVSILLFIFGLIQLTLALPNAPRITNGAFVITGKSILPAQTTNFCQLFNTFNSNPLKNGKFSNDHKLMITGNAPLTSIPELTFCQGSMIDIPVTVSDFNNIGALSITLNYDPSVLAYQSFSANTGFPGLTANGNTPGVIMAGGFTSSLLGITLNDGSVLFTFQFYFSGGTSSLIWLDNGASCEYTGPAPDYSPLNDIPFNLYYINGLTTESLLPSQAGIITGPVGGNVCIGETNVIFTVEPVDNAESYEWLLPIGATIIEGEGSNIIKLSFGNNALSGMVSVYGINSCGNGISSPEFSVTINDPPSILSQPISPDLVVAGMGTALFTVVASGAYLTFQWQEYHDSWENIVDGGVYAGSLNETLAIIDPPLSMNGLQYRCIVSGICDPPGTTDGNAFLSVTNQTGISDEDSLLKLSNESLIILAYPNPCQGSAKISYYIPIDGRVIVEIRSMMGKSIEILSDHNVTKGDFNLFLDSGKYYSGIYLIHILLVYNNFTISNSLKIIL